MLLGLLILGRALFTLGILFFFAANLQHPGYEILISYGSIICGVGLLHLVDWKRHKNTPKKVSIFAILCFILGFSGYVFGSEKTWVTWVLLVFLLLSIIFGIIFKINNRKQEGKLVGNSLAVAGIILSVPILLFSLFYIIFDIEKWHSQIFTPQGLEQNYKPAPK